MNDAFICDAIRTPSAATAARSRTVRTDDLAAIPLARADRAQPRRRLGARSTTSSTAAPTRPARTTATSAAWRCCSPACRSKCPAPRSTACAAPAWTRIAIAARAIKSGETALMIAGGVESMTRAPFVMAKADSAFSRAAKIEDTTIGWRFVNPLMKAKYGVDSMPETAENVAAEFKRRARRPGRLRAAQPAARARRRSPRAGSPRRSSPVTIPAKKGDPVVVRAGRASARDDARGAGASSRASCAPTAP